MTPEEQISILQEKLNKERELAEKPWPREVIVYLNSDKESNRTAGENAGLSEEAISENFIYALYEVTFRLSVNEDGTYEILGYEE